VVESVEVRGAQRVSPELVQTAAGIRPGATLTAQSVQELILRLVATRQYETVQVFVRGAEQGRGALVIDGARAAAPGRGALRGAAQRLRQHGARLGGAAW
jgi:outer membrane translocation and assembly module TamA